MTTSGVELGLTLSQAMIMMIVMVTNSCAVESSLRVGHQRIIRLAVLDGG